MTVRDDVKKIIRDRLDGQQTLVKLNRLGVVQQVNPDGTASILVDGQLFSARSLYPMVQGQQAVLIPGDAGDFSAAPTSPAPIPPEPQEPDYFVGGFIRWGSVVPTTFGGPLGEIAFQDTGISNVYVLNFSDLPGYAPLPILTFSPDGTRVCVVFQNNSTKLAHIRVYRIGQTLTGTIIPPPSPVQGFTLNATLLFDIVRPSFLPTTLASTFVADAFITDDPNSVWWLEVQYNPFTIGTGVNGQIVNTLHLMQVTNSNPTPVEVGHTITTVFFQTTPNQSATAFRAMWTVGPGVTPFVGYGNGIFAAFGGIWSPDRFQLLGLIEDPQNGFGSVAGPILTGLGVNQNDFNNETIGPAAAAILLGNGNSFSENGWNLVSNGVNVGSGGITIVKQSATGDVFNYTGNLPPNGSFSVGTPPKTPSFSRNFRASPFANVVSQTVGPAHTSFFYQDIKSGIITEALLLPPDATTTNSIGPGSEIMLSSKGSGFALDDHGSPGPYLRRITSSDGGLTFIADPVSKAIQITPKQTILPFPPVAFPTSSGIIKGVSTR